MNTTTAVQFLADNGDKIPDDVKAEVTTDLEALKGVLENAEAGAEELTAALGPAAAAEFPCR